MTPIESTITLFQEKNHRTLSITYLLSTIFTVIGYILDTPREYECQHYLLFYTNIFIICLQLIVFVVFLLRKINISNAFSIIAYSQIILSLISVLFHLHNKDLLEHHYSLEIILQMIYISIIGFLIHPKHVFYYGGIALIENVILRFYGKSKDFDFLDIYTIILLGFSLAMYIFTKNNIKQFANASRLTQQVKEQNKKIIELNNFKNDLSSMLVHDIKTPLSLIVSKSESKDVKDAAQRINYMVHNILHIEKYQDTKLELNIDSFSINESIKTSLDHFQYAIDKKHIKVNYAPAQCYTTEADKVIIERILDNLLSNALRFTKPNGIITVKVRSIPDSKVEVSLRNTGRTIQEDKLESIFDKYYQIKESNSTINSGLGLTFCQMAIQAHSQDIWAENIGKNEVGFFFTLPLIENNNVKNSPFETIHNLTLTPEEKDLLSPIYRKIEDVKIYNASTILKEIVPLENTESKNISQWIQQLKEAIYTGNTELYSQLLDILS